MAAGVLGALAFFGCSPDLLWLGLIVVGIGALSWRCPCWACSPWCWPPWSCRWRSAPARRGRQPGHPAGPGAARRLAAGHGLRSATPGSVAHQCPWPSSFLGAFSLLIGRATGIPGCRRDNFLLVQLAQWAIFAFSAVAFWLTGNLIKDERWLWRLTAVFLWSAAGWRSCVSCPARAGRASSACTYAFIRAPFWVLLTALAAGQLSVQPGSVAALARVFLVAACAGGRLASALSVQQRGRASNWVGAGGRVGTLVWLRFPRLRWPVIILLVFTDPVRASWFRASIDFAGGDAEWARSGGSRLALIGRVIEVTMRNPDHRPGPGRVPALRTHEAATLPGRLLGRATDQLPQQLRGPVRARRDPGAWLVLLVPLWEVARLGLRLRKRYASVSPRVTSTACWRPAPAPW